MILIDQKFTCGWIVTEWVFEPNGQKFERAIGIIKREYN